MSSPISSVVAPPSNLSVTPPTALWTAVAESDDNGVPPPSSPAAAPADATKPKKPKVSKVERAQLALNKAHEKEQKRRDSAVARADLTLFKAKVVKRKRLESAAGKLAVKVAKLSAQLSEQQTLLQDHTSEIYSLLAQEQERAFASGSVSKADQSLVAKYLTNLKDQYEGIDYEIDTSERGADHFYYVIVEVSGPSRWGLNKTFKSDTLFLMLDDDDYDSDILPSDSVRAAMHSMGLSMTWSGEHYTYDAGDKRFDDLPITINEKRQASHTWD